MNRGEREAEKLLRHLRVANVPVPVDLIASRQGAEVRYARFDGNISGLLLRRENEQIIGVHEEQVRTRQRFTIAHELGHLVMHRGRPVIVEHLWRANVNWRDGISGQATDREEIEANQFAAALLMPRKLVENDYYEVSAGPSAVDAVLNYLAQRYEVSSQAMRFRLVNLALLDPA